MDGNEKTERKGGVLRWVKTFLAAQLEWDWFDLGDIFDFESIPAAVGGLAALAAVLCLFFGFFAVTYGFFAITYQLIVDPDAVRVAARLDSLSINPDKHLPRS